MKLMLVMITPRAWAGRLVPVARSPFVIGRAPGCQLRAHTPEVAMQHCALLLRGSQVFVRDLEGSPGICVNGRPVPGEQQVQDQDQVQVGCLAFTVRLESSATQLPAEPAPPSEAEETAASLLLAQDSAQASGDSVVGLADETLPVEGGHRDSAPSAPALPAKSSDPEPADTAAAAAKLLERCRKVRGSGRGK
jgi:predicted component of type VI protein secretion system